jgi:hypothetical protein
MLPRWRLQVGLTLAGCLLATSCTGTSGRSAAVASTSSSSTTTTTTTRPPTTTSPPLSGGYLAKWSIGGMLLRLTITGPNTVGGLAIYRFLPSPTTGELLTIEFLPATVEDYNRALRNAKP